MEHLRVPKRRVPVEITLVGGTVRSALLFLSEFAMDRAGEERVVDVLNASEDFLPALDPATQQTVLLNRRQIAVVRMDPALEPAEEVPEAPSTEHQVKLTLTSGAVLQGRVAYLLPPDRSRLADFLNSEGRFFRLMETNRLALVSKQQLAQVEAVSG